MVATTTRICTMAGDPGDEADAIDYADLGELELSRRERVASGTIGIAMSLTGAVATFTGSSEVGTGALLGAGGIFLLMSTTGRPLISAKIGENEIRLARRLIRRVETKLESAPPDVRAELAEAVLDVTPESWRPIARRAEGAAFEARLAKAIKRLAAKSVVEQEVRIEDGLIDLLIRRQDVTVGVELKYWSRPLDATVVRQTLERARRLGINKMLIVASSGFTSSAKHMQSMNVELLHWTGVEDDASLEAALRKLSIVD